MVFQTREWSSTMKYGVLALGMIAGTIWTQKKRKKLPLVPEKSSTNNGQQKAKLLVATRIHEKQASKPVDETVVVDFVKMALKYGDYVCIAVCAEPDGGGEDLVQRVSKAVAQGLAESEAAAGRGGEGGGGGQGPRRRRAWAAAVAPWGAFVPALNALLGEARRRGAHHLLYQSMETVLDKDIVNTLRSHLTSTDLVVGAALPGHDFQEGRRVALGGTTTPWNTAAVWDARTLSLTGFPPVADGLLPGLEPGVEEVAAITLLQHIKPEISNAKVIRMPQIQWVTKWRDPERQAWHERKMASKARRAAAQVAALGLPRGEVEHINAVSARPATPFY